MKRMKGVVISGVNQMELRDDCPLPKKISPTGALIRPEIWSPCTSVRIYARLGANRFHTCWEKQWGMRCAV